MKDYAEYQRQRDAEYVEACKAAGIEPMLHHDKAAGGSSEEDHDALANVPSNAPDHRYFDDPVEDAQEEPAEGRYKLAADAVLRVLYVLTGSEHPSLRLSADCLLAIINRSEEKSQAAIARKYQLTRAAVSKRMRDMRRGKFLGGLEIYFFGGREDVSQQARERALRVHRRRKESQPSNPCKNPSLLDQIQQLKPAA